MTSFQVFIVTSYPITLFSFYLWRSFLVEVMGVLSIYTSNNVINFHACVRSIDEFVFSLGVRINYFSLPTIFSYHEHDDPSNFNNLTSIQFLTLNHVKSYHTCYDWDLVMHNSEYPPIFLNIKLVKL